MNRKSFLHRAGAFLAATAAILIPDGIRRAHADWPGQCLVPCQCTQTWWGSATWCKWEFTRCAYDNPSRPSLYQNYITYDVVTHQICATGWGFTGGCC